MDYIIKAVQQEDWPEVKAIRLASLRDPDAHLAFLETYEQALARPDDLWQDRAKASAEGTDTRQFVAQDPAGRWLGTVTARVELPGVELGFGARADAPQTHLVGVFVQPDARGTGLAQELLRAAVEWSWSLSEPRIERVRLYVHEKNLRAQAMYRKAGFQPTGTTVPVPADPTQLELEFAVPRD